MNLKIQTKSIRLVLAAALIGLVSLGCSSPTSSVPDGDDAGGGDPVTYTVTFDSRGADTEANPSFMTVTTPDAALDTLPLAPVKSGMEFAGWYTEPEGEGTAFNPSVPVSGDIVVFAYWIPGEAAVEAPMITHEVSSDPALTLVSLSTPTEGSSVYYTLDGSAPSAGSILYEGPFSVDSTRAITVRAVAVKDGISSPEAGEGGYTVPPSRSAAPSILPEGGLFDSARSVALAAEDPDAEILYTLDGSDPSGGIVYSGPFELDADATVKALARKAGLAESSVVEAVFRFLPAPPDLSSSKTGNEVTLVWNEVEGAVSYNLYWTKDTTVTPETGTKVEGVSSGFLFVLRDKAPHSFLVAAVNANGEGLPSEVVTERQTK